MKFVLLENGTDKIVSKVDLNCIDVAVNYFKGMKRMPEDKDFNRLWRVMSDEDYESQRETSYTQKEGHTRQYEWWKEEPKGLDDGIDY